MLKSQIRKEEAKKISVAKKELRIKKNDAKRKTRIYKSLRVFVYHKDIKDLSSIARLNLLDMLPNPYFPSKSVSQSP
jgi:hypothetical protein